MVCLRIIILLLVTSSLYSKDLSQEEIIYFGLLDINNDNYISYKEVEQISNLVFQLIDKNQDNKISIEEVNDLNEIINLLK